MCQNMQGLISANSAPGAAGSNKSDCSAIYLGLHCLLCRQECRHADRFQNLLVYGQLTGGLKQCLGSKNLPVPIVGAGSGSLGGTVPVARARP